MTILPLSVTICSIYLVDTITEAALSKNNDSLQFNHLIKCLSITREALETEKTHIGYGY
jgi:hypothetical protein